MTQKLNPHEQLQKLRVPFAPHHISKLPKENKTQMDERKARKQGCMVWKCQECGGAHHKDAIHLDYVGHAAATDRLLDTDPEWAWEPVSYDQNGLPAFDQFGGLWIKLTVCGVTRLGYGHPDGKQGGNAIKEAIGDAIRNSGMRFGMALDLWHKGDLHLDDEEGGEPDVSKGRIKEQPAAKINKEQLATLNGLADAVGADKMAFCKYAKVSSLSDILASDYQSAVNTLTSKSPDAAKEYLTGGK